MSTDFDLVAMFNEWNQKCFDGGLAVPHLVWNSRLRTCAGRFVPGSRGLVSQFGVFGGMRGNRRITRFKSQHIRFPQIEMATYLRELPNAEFHIRDTLGHEMIHYWLWERGRSFGHTQEFLKKMKDMGVSRYNPVPKVSGTSFRYECPSCKRQWVRKKRYTKRVACFACCKANTNGKYADQYRLVKV